MSGPHWKVFKKHLLSSPKQFLSSWYIFLIQLPKIAEWFICSHHYKIFTDKIKGSAFNNPYPNQELEELRQSWIKNKSMESMLNWYRALSKFRDERLTQKITVPVTLIWGKKDPFVRFEMAQDCLEYCENGTLILLENTGHWVHHENKNELHREMLKVLK